MVGTVALSFDRIVGSGGRASRSFSAQSFCFARAPKCDSEKLRSFNKLNRFARPASSPSAPFASGTSSGYNSCDKLERGRRYSDLGLGDGGLSSGTSELVFGRCSWSLFALTRSKTLRRFGSSGMAGTRVCYIDHSYISKRVWWLAKPGKKGRETVAKSVC